MSRKKSSEENPFRSLMHDLREPEPGSKKRKLPPAPPVVDEDVIDAIVETIVEPKALPPATEAAKPPHRRIKPRPWGKSGNVGELDADGNRKRGRPATGKRSDLDWAARTYYTRHQTDVTLDRALWKLRRAGHDVDKSELADALLNAWAQVELGEVDDLRISEILDVESGD